MAIYRRFKVQRKYVNGQPTEEYRLGAEIDSTDYNSLEECNRGSDCTQLEYRWVDMESADDYICDGNNKYKKQRKQQKCVTEEAWTNVYPYEYQKGDLIEQNSVDCGYEPSVGYHIYGRTDGHGSINISPSKEYYSSADVVTITALPSTDYIFSCYNYGGNMTYGSVAYNSVLSLTMSHNWYVSAVFSYSLSLYYLYTSINGQGSIMVTPSKNEYSQRENVNILAFPSANYMFENYEYGSTPAYGSTILRPDLDLTMSNNWYVKANFVYGTTSSGSLYYSYTTGSESWYNWSKSTLERNDNSGSLASIINDYGGTVQSIRSWAFNIHSYLTKIVLPNVGYIGEGAFAQGSKLSQIDFPLCTSVDRYAFGDCSLLTSVNLQNCSFIGEEVFGHCVTLPSIDLPVCSYVGHNAFWYCSSLTTVNLPNCLSIDSYAFAYCPLITSVSLPNCLSISEEAFGYCSALTSIDLPNCSYIGEKVFWSCSSLTTVNLQNCLSVGYAAFGECSSLISVNLPNCSFIGSSTFSNCIVLPSIDLPLCISIGYYTFYKCSMLISVNLPLCVSVDSYAFEYCSALPSIDLPNCLYVGNKAFERCSALQSVNLPNCSYIGNSTFSSCSTLTSINLQNCTYIGDSAFYYCKTLPSIDLPVCSYVGYDAFDVCLKLSIVHLPKVTYIGSSAFSNAHIETLYMSQITSVPSGGDPNINRSYIKSIFIPCSLLDSFVSHSIWSKYSSYYVCV